MTAAAADDDDPAARTAPRHGAQDLPAHLRGTYGIAVAGVTELDLGTYRVDRTDGPSWIARLHPAQRPLDRAHGDAGILSLLAERGYPAERCAAPEPVSELHGQPLIVTEYVTPVPRGERRRAIVAAGGLRALGELLGRLQTEAVPSRPGGAWHHLADGPPSAELAAAARLLEVVGADERLWTALEACDGGDGLPEALLHPDFVMANVVAAADGGLVLVDWSGAGRGPRAWSLAFLLWSVGFGGDLARVDRVADGYRREIALEPEELERLPAMIGARAVVFDAWGFATGRRTAREAAVGVADSREKAAAIAQRARGALA